MFGRWGERSLEAFQLVSKAGASRASERVVAAGNHMRRSMSIGLQRLNARILLSRMDPLAELFSEPAAMPWGSGEGLHCADPVADALAARPPPEAGMMQAVRLCPLSAALFL